MTNSRTEFIDYVKGVSWFRLNDISAWGIPGVLQMKKIK